MTSWGNQCEVSKWTFPVVCPGFWHELSLCPDRNLLHHSLAKANQRWWPPPTGRSTNYHLWTPSWHPAGGKSCQANWNCAFSVVKVLFLHRKKKEKKKMKLGKVEFCHFLQLIALVLCFSGMSQAELSRSSSKPYFQSGRPRTKRSWVWNQFFVLEEYMGSDPLYVGKVGHVAFRSHSWLLGMSVVGWRTAHFCFGVREHETFTLLSLNYEQLKPTLSRGGLVLMDFFKICFLKLFFG